MSMFSVRVFNEEGLSEFERAISEMRNGSAHNISENLLFDESYSSVLQPITNIQFVEYRKKSELIPYIVECLNLQSNKHLYFNTGLWSWLAAFYFENICPEDGHGKRKINETAFYVLKDPKNYTKFYRHLLAYPSRVLSELEESSRIFLIGSFSKRGEITEQFGAYQEISLNKGIIDAADILYWDKLSEKLKKGAAGKGAGSARRLVRIIRQYQLTYDLNSMRGKEIVKLLPDEFERWLKE